jgi:hypothetical protein
MVALEGDRVSRWWITRAMQPTERCARPPGGAHEAASRCSRAARMAGGQPILSIFATSARWLCRRARAARRARRLMLRCTRIRRRPRRAISGYLLPEAMDSSTRCRTPSAGARRSPERRRRRACGMRASKATRCDSTLPCRGERTRLWTCRSARETLWRSRRFRQRARAQRTSSWVRLCCSISAVDDAGARRGAVSGTARATAHDAAGWKALSGTASCDDFGRNCAAEPTGAGAVLAGRAVDGYRDEGTGDGAELRATGRACPR